MLSFDLTFLLPMYLTSSICHHQNIHQSFLQGQKLSVLVDEVLNVYVNDTAGHENVCMQRHART